MWQPVPDKVGSGQPEKAADTKGTADRRQRFDVADLFEELLGKRAELGYRPVLYISSERDLECTLIGLFEEMLDEDLHAERMPIQTSVEELRRRLG